MALSATGRGVNHLLVIVRDDTYAAMANDVRKGGLLSKLFANTTIRKTCASFGCYEGLYITGSTGSKGYVEFMPASALKANGGVVSVPTQLKLGGDDRASYDEVRRRLADLAKSSAGAYSFSEQHTSRPTPADPKGPTYPWFDYVEARPTGDRNDALFWFVGYDGSVASYFRQLPSAPKPGEPVDISRSHVNVVSFFDSGERPCARLMGDIVGVTLAGLGPNQRKALADTAAAAGFRSTAPGVFANDELVVRAPSGLAMIGIETALAHGKAETSLRNGRLTYGNLTITVGDDRALIEVPAYSATAADKSAGDHVRAGGLRRHRCDRGTARRG